MASQPAQNLWMAELTTRLAEVQKVVGHRLQARMATRDGVLKDAMIYALTGGKALRGLLVLEGARLHSVDREAAIDVALAIECLHAYSLVHDDLPCMDDDDLRRGKPTVHRKWDEAIAVLAGDALQTLAFECLATANLNAEPRLKLIKTFATASGIDGMIGGQMRDIAAETSTEPLSLDEITVLQKAKTGALITWSCTAGPMMVGADKTPLAQYGDALGLAFQIADDLLDIEGRSDVVGKAVGKDESAGKATFVSLLGVAEAKSRAQKLVDHACDALSLYGKDADILRDAARFVVARDR